MTKRKLIVIGLDSAVPDLVFNRWRGELPNMDKIMDEGFYGELKSTIPPITCPAWMSMVTGKDPGTLGFYGFRNREDYSYDRMTMATSLSVKADTVWDILGEKALTSVLIGVPQTYPPKPVRGYLITCFLTPGTNSDYTYPKELRKEIETEVGTYIFDVENFRTDDKEDLLRQIYEMTERRFRAARYLMKNKEWDFFMIVEMGIDRIQHGMWKFFDEEHPKYVEGSKYKYAIKNYYRYIDEKIGELLSEVDDNTSVLIVSDHGAKRLVGGVCINEWLIQEGYLVLKEHPEKQTPIDKVGIDWDKTYAWGAGGYYGRVFLNVKGREPRGIIEPEEYESFRDELGRKLEDIKDEKGSPMGTKVFKPEEIYDDVKGIPPDLIVYFGDLYWRSVGSVGLGEVLTFENDTGPDDANHDQYGIFVMKGRSKDKRGYVGELDITDCASIILREFGIWKTDRTGGCGVVR